MAKTKPKTFEPYTTFTGLLIYVEADEGQFVVCIAKDIVKELLRTPDEAAAIKYAEGLKADYETRKDAEA